MQYALKFMRKVMLKTRKCDRMTEINKLEGCGGYMKGIILYKSKYGATQKYAEWLVEATGFECIETNKAKISEVKKYDVVILGGGIYASGIAGLSFLKKNLSTFFNNFSYLLKTSQSLILCGL